MNGRPVYVISSVTAVHGGTVVYEIVTADLQRIHIGIRRKWTDTDTARDVIDHALAALYAPPKPLHQP